MSGLAGEPDVAALALADDAAHLLVVDDDRRIRDLLSRFLRKEGYRVTLAEDAAEARVQLTHLAFDLIVLDAMMPGETGFAFAAHLRQSSDVPILMLTARGDADDRIRGLEAGVDDYLAKPYEPRELLLRIASILRRAAPRQAAFDRQLRFGPFVFELGRGELRRGEELVRLTERERDMLQMLAENAGETVSRDALARTTVAANERTIDVQVNRLRRKIERDPANPVHLQTVRGLGYRLFLNP